MVPLWALVISRAMDRPRPEPPLARERLVSRRTKRSKTRCRSCSGIPSPSSDTVMIADPFCSAVARSDRGVCRAGGVVDEVAQYLAQPGRIADDPDRMDVARHGQVRRRTPQPLDLGRDQVVEIDVDLPHPDTGVVGLREQQEVLDQLPHPIGLGRHHLMQLVPRLPGRVRLDDLQSRRQSGQRRPQLVAGVRHERSLRRLTGLQPVEHLVHGRPRAARSRPGSAAPVPARSGRRVSMRCTRPRIRSTGRRAWPTISHSATPTTISNTGKPIARYFVTVATVCRWVSTDDATTTVYVRPPYAAAARRSGSSDRRRAAASRRPRRGAPRRRPGANRSAEWCPPGPTRRRRSGRTGPGPG